MQHANLRHRLAAIMAADGVGYSRLMSKDERSTVMALDAARDVFRAEIAANGGRVVDTAGDSVLAMFETAIGAVAAAVAIQRQLAEALGDTAVDACLRFRIGVHLGDVFEKSDGTVYGDGVNIASRIEGLAEPGGIAVSQSVQAAVQSRGVASFEDIGEQTVKNMAQPIRVFRLRGDYVLTDAGRSRPPRASPRALRIAGAAIIAAIAAALIAVAASGWRPGLTVSSVAAGQGAPSSGTAARDLKTVAVLPFANLSDDKGNEYFADAVTDELMSTLSRTRGLRVANRSSAFYFKGKSVPVAEMARQLGVAYLVDGTVRKTGERMRISAQLVDAANGLVLWTDTFETEFKDTLVAQINLALKIAQSLKVPMDASTVAGSGTTNVEAWQLFLQAQRLPLEQRDDLYHRALSIDPKFARAYMELARGAFSSVFRGVAPKVARDRSVAYLNEVLRIDPLSAEAYGRLASAEVLVDDMPAVRRNVQRALELDPNDVAARNWKADLALEAGQMDEALAERKLMVHASPLSWLPRFQYAELLGLANRPGDALAAVEDALLLEPSQPGPPAEKAAILLQLGRRDEALVLARLAGNIAVLAKIGTREDLAALTGRTDLDAHERAALDLAAGRYDAFLDHFENEHNDLPLRGPALFGPDLDPLRQLPRFQAWLVRHNLTRAHDRAQAWRAANPAPKAPAR